MKKIALDEFKVFWKSLSDEEKGSIISFIDKGEEDDKVLPAPQYLVLSTGYTGRLVPDIEEIEDSMEENDEKIRVLYIEDSVYGEGEYEFGPKQEIEFIKRLLKRREKSLDGIIIFAGSFHIRNLLEILTSMEYCYGLDGTPYEIFELSDKVKYMRFDCESG